MWSMASICYITHVPYFVWTDQNEVHVDTQFPRKSRNYKCLRIEMETKKARERFFHNRKSQERNDHKSRILIMPANTLLKQIYPVSLTE